MNSIKFHKKLIDYQFHTTKHRRLTAFSVRSLTCNRKQKEKKNRTMNKTNTLNKARIKMLRNIPKTRDLVN